MRIVVIEDDQTVAAFLQRGLQEAGHTVYRADNGIDGLDALLNESADVAIVDLMLPGLDGLTAIERARQRGVSLPVLILSARRSIDERIQGLRAGGDDYLVKPFAFGELLARVEALARRARGAVDADTGRLDYRDLSLDLLSRRAARAGQPISLQPREFMLLEYLMRHAEQVVSRTMILERVWNYSFDPGTNVVEARISKLREKVDRNFDVPLIHTVRGTGYVLRGPEP